MHLLIKILLSRCQTHFYVDLRQYITTCFIIIIKIGKYIRYYESTYVRTFEHKFTYILGRVAYK